MNKVTGTDFMNLGATNIFTFGLGYHIKGFYANVAYKYRMQKGDFYAFNPDYQLNRESGHPLLNQDANQFITEATSLRPVEVNLDRHDITFTLGYEFGLLYSCPDDVLVEGAGNAAQFQRVAFEA